MVSDRYRGQVLQYAVREYEICQVFAALRAIHVEPILLKGWSVARHYADPTTRQLGDIDLLVRPSELQKARQAVSAYIDWHTLADEALRRRSQLIALGTSEIRVLCLEDNLRFVAIHMLRHGAWSPQWLQDVKVLLESRTPDFDWNVCLSSDSIHAGWVKSALVLTRDLLSADITNTPAECHQIPAWLIPAVKKAWQHPDPEDNQPPESIRRALTHPWRLPQGLKKRWPTPITAAIETGAPLNEVKLKNQLTYYANLAIKRTASRL